jgi:hypothetical protein
MLTIWHSKVSYSNNVYNRGGIRIETPASFCFTILQNEKIFSYKRARKNIHSKMITPFSCRTSISVIRFVYCKEPNCLQPLRTLCSGSLQMAQYRYKAYQNRPGGSMSGLARSLRGRWLTNSTRLTFTDGRESALMQPIGKTVTER